MTEVAIIRNRADYDRKFLGMSISIDTSETALPREDFEALNKNCINFQQMTNPPENGGQPHIRVTGSKPNGDVVLNGQGLGEPTLFTAPRVRLKANGVTHVSKKNFKKLKRDSRFQNLIESNDVEFVGWSEE